MSVMDLCINVVEIIKTGFDIVDTTLFVYCNMVEL